MNERSYLNIPQTVRHHVNTLFESFVLDRISRRSSCSFETVLRSGVTFDQPARAREGGFMIELRYVALRDFSMHVERVKLRSDAGGHSAPILFCGLSIRRPSGTCHRRSGRWTLCTFTTTALGASHPRVAAGRERRSCLLGRRSPALAGDTVRVAPGRAFGQNARRTSVTRLAIVNCTEVLPGALPKPPPGIRLWVGKQISYRVARPRHDQSRKRSTVPRYEPIDGYIPSAGTQSSTRGIFRIATRWGIPAGLPSDHQSVYIGRDLLTMHTASRPFLVQR